MGEWERRETSRSHVPLPRTTKIDSYIAVLNELHNLVMKRGESAKLHRRCVRSPDNARNGKMEGEEDEMEFKDPVLNQRCDSDCIGGTGDVDDVEVVVFSVSPIIISIGKSNEEEQTMNGTLLATSQRLVFASSNQLVDVAVGGIPTQGGCLPLCCWKWSSEDWTLDIHSMILHAVNSAEPNQSPSIYCQFQEEGCSSTYHVTMFPADETVCQQIQQSFVALSQRNCTSFLTSDDDQPYEEATEEERATMLARLDALLVVPPELEIPSESEEDEEMPSMHLRQNKKRQYEQLLDLTSYTVEGQFDDADG